MKPLDDLAGACPAIVSLREKVAEFLRRQSATVRQPAVLIQGDTGTGKGLLARALHQAGPRAGGPFVDVNCAAIPETLLEAELFGYERGAFTDARQAKLGLFQTAHTGTLFLDEIGLLPAALQSKLLNVLEAGAVRRLGSTRSQPVNVWIIAATNENLIGAVRAKEFREDLYHRLAVMTFTLPPLRERGRDVVLLAERFLAQLCIEYALPEKSFAKAALAALQSYDWPGNIRELSNVIERALLLSDSAVVTVEALQLPSFTTRTRQPDAQIEAPNPDEAARLQLLDALTKTSWNISRTAALLSLTRNTVRARIERFHLASPPDPSRRPPRRPPPLHADASSLAARPDALPVTSEPLSLPVSVRWNRRRVAVLRVGLGDSARLEPAPLESNEALKVIIEKVRSFGGTVEDVSLDGVQALFGLEPLEDPPRRAAHAGLAIQRTLAQALTSPPSRIAIHTSEVLVVSMRDTVQIDARSKQQIAPFMDSLIAATEVGSIVASATAAAFLRRRFVLAPVASSVPGLASYTILGHEQFNIGELEKGPRFVGRHEELGLLQARLASAVAGRGRLVSVIGDSGVGKSRLVWEFTRSNEARAARLLEIGSAYAAITPYLPVIELVRRYFAIEADADADRIREHLRAVITAGDGRSGASLAALQALLGAPDADWATLDSVERRHLTLEAVKRLLLTESQRQPLMIVFEDVHWIDSESQAVLNALVEALPTSQMLLVVTYRPEYRHDWSGLSYYTQLSVGPLSSNSANELLEDLLGTHPSLEPVKRHLIHWTDGNPFFLEESVQALIETGVFRGDRGAYQASCPTPAAEVPATVEDILAARIDRLSAPDRALVQCAGAIGVEVPMTVLSAIVDLSHDALRSGLRRLQAAELLHESATSMGGGVVFKHAVTREVTYRSLLPQARRDLHRRIVTAIEATASDSGPENIDRLAHHAFQAELWSKAAAYLKHAGDLAMGSAAAREAAAYFDRSLQALTRLPQAGQVLNDVIDLRLRMRDAFWLQLPASSILDHLREADAIAERVHDRGRQGWIACYLCHYFWAIGDLEHALGESERALALGHSLNNPAVVVETNFYRGIVQLALGDFRRSVTTLTDTLAALGAAGLDFPSRRFALHGPLILRSFLIRSLAELGEFREAIARGEEAMSPASRSPYASAAVSGGLGLMYVRKGEPARAVQILEPGLQLCRTYGLNNWIATVGGSLGAAYVALGRTDEGVALLQAAVDHGDRFGLAASNSLWVIFLGEGHLRAGRRSEALAVASRGLTLCRERKERGYEAWALRLLAKIVGSGGAPDYEEARSTYDEALAVGRECGMRPLISSCQFELGMLNARLGHHGEAAGQLAAAAAAFKALDMPLPVD
jgi:transcriptional regulator with AAA-type ATPase domain/tetratricopeptide (TPR) repeat protein